MWPDALNSSSRGQKVVRTGLLFGGQKVPLRMEASKSSPRRHECLDTV